jgi:two-component sensor histidine kinase
VLARLEQVFSGLPQRTETAIMRKDGRRVEVAGSVSSLVVQGRSIGILVMFRDISADKAMVEELRQSQECYRNTAEANARLLQELDHRVRNNLAELASLIDLTREGAKDMDSFAAALRDRVRAMAQTHTVLAASHGEDVDLRWLTERLVEGLRLGWAHRIPMELDGPQVMIGQQQARPLAMMLCELFTNSCKHGAHSRTGGRVRVAWELLAGDGSARVRLRWIESGGPPVRRTPQARLGMKLNRGFIEYDLHGRCTLRFARQGVDHVFEFAAVGHAASQAGSV